MPYSKASCEHERAYSNAMRLLTQIPVLEYVTDVRSNDYRRVLSDGVAVFHVTNEAEFNSALGFSLDKNEGNWVAPDEYIWSRYRSKSAPMSVQCLQIQLFMFLCIKSDSFHKKYSRLQKKLIGSCLSDRIDNDDDHCFICALHPNYA